MGKHCCDEWSLTFAYHNYSCRHFKRDHCCETWHKSRGKHHWHGCKWYRSEKFDRDCRCKKHHRYHCRECFSSSFSCPYSRRHSHHDSSSSSSDCGCGYSSSSSCSSSSSSSCWSSSSVYCYGCYQNIYYG